MAAVLVEVPDLTEATGKPDLAAIAGALRNERVWSPEARRWLADLLDPQSRNSTGWSLHQKKGRGRPRKLGLPHIDAVLFFDNQTDSTNRKRAIGATIEEHKISMSTLEAAIPAAEHARDEHARIISEECWPQHPNAPPPFPKK